MPTVKLDTVVHAETPEGLQLTLRPAGITPRAYAFAIDWIIRLLVFIVLSSTLLSVGGIGQGVLLVAYFLCEWFYPVVFELTASGATPGKRLMHLQVIMDNGLPVTPAAAMVRNLLRVADFLPLAFGLGLVTMLCRRDFKRLGDLAAGTLVVYRGHVAATTTLPEGDPQPPQHPLNSAAQVAIVGLAARAARLTPERVEELAALLPERALPRVEDATASRSRQVFGLARWLVGHRSR